ncbi:FadR/GntR family transcriptional regulator [Pollutimonas bauzanensis]|uniref:DNA-binding transcriptional regulator, FadR family n=1 Tax=Pollutimonas bauzanensis TaxID=658167 RepID=A0A1M5ZEW4_9BURK|nr:FadR/GntR family transcriptional regulator [Pollutimonas bauzanensis]SHI22473.1 DNA-binding transcriptional regulator, FadR family [Pollutimonas bauzanensis]
MDNEWLKGVAAGAAVSRTRIVDQVRDSLLAAIRQGALKVNDRLPSENEMATTFGVSRPVIREAITSLQVLGLIASRPGSGNFVASSEVNADLILGGFRTSDLSQVRKYLELPSAEQSAIRATDQQMQSLSKLLSTMESESDPEKRNLLDAEFHVQIAISSGNALLAKLIAGLRRLLEEESKTATAISAGRRLPVHFEHHAILEAIQSRDPAAARKAMLDHLDAVEKTINDSPQADGASGSARLRRT